MTTQGTIPSLDTPSEIRERPAKARKESKPTGGVSRCEAGLAPLIQARRDEALAAIAAVCRRLDQATCR